MNNYQDKNKNNRLNQNNYYKHNSNNFYTKPKHLNKYQKRHLQHEREKLLKGLSDIESITDESNNLSENSFIDDKQISLFDETYDFQKKLKYNNSNNNFYSIKNESTSINDQNIIKNVFNKKRNINSVLKELDNNITYSFEKTENISEINNINNETNNNQSTCTSTEDKKQITDKTKDNIYTNFPNFFKKEIIYNSVNTSIVGVILLGSFIFLFVCLYYELSNKPSEGNWYNSLYFILIAPWMLFSLILFSMYVHKINKIIRYLKNVKSGLYINDNIIYTLYTRSYTRIINTHWIYISGIIVSLLFILLTLTVTYFINKDYQNISHNFGNMYIGDSTHSSHKFPLYAIIATASIDILLIALYIIKLVFNIRLFNDIDLNSKGLDGFSKWSTIKTIRKSNNRRNIIIFFATLIFPSPFIFIFISLFNS